VVEAMKMQNILRAPRRATVKKVRVAAGVSLKVDQIILDFDE
jgi:propionyl-CoA carboxylase alpha chain